MRKNPGRKQLRRLMKERGVKLGAKSPITCFPKRRLHSKQK